MSKSTMCLCGLLLTLAAGVHAQAFASERNDSVLMQGNRAGAQSVTLREDGTVHAEYSCNDRDHGDHIAATWKLDRAGIPIAYDASGHDYMKAPVEEMFRLQRGQATWKNRHENGKQALRAAAFYMPANPPPEFYGVLTRALLKAPHRQLALLPSGTCRAGRPPAVGHWRGRDRMG